MAVPKQMLFLFFQVAVEALCNIRTVPALGCETSFLREYVSNLNALREINKRHMYSYGAVLAASRSWTCFRYASSLYYGGTLVANENLDYGHNLM